jgi:hypothetical protein
LSAASALARAPDLAGRKPTKPNASVGRPALASAASSAEAPGLANTGRLASRTARTSGKPGSDSSGVPASEICAMARPASMRGDDLADAGPLIVLVQRSARGADAVVIEQRGRVTGVFAQDQLGGRQRLERPECVMSRRLPIGVATT